jgi:hypothetical protein
MPHKRITSTRGQAALAPARRLRQRCAGHAARERIRAFERQVALMERFAIRRAVPGYRSPGVSVAFPPRRRPSCYQRLQEFSCGGPSPEARRASRSRQWRRARRLRCHRNQDRDLMPSANSSAPIPVAPTDRSTAIQVIVQCAPWRCEGVSSCTPSTSCQIISRSLFWLSSRLERGLEPALFRPRSVFHTAITGITTARSTSPMFGPVFSATRSADHGGTALRSLSTPPPAFAAGVSRCAFRD